jgi:tetratricopeptide (TPR) repeat protein
MNKDRKKAVRLREAIEAFNSEPLRQRRKHHDIGITGKPWSADSFVQWSATAWIALRLRKEDRALKKAFKEFNLDPDNPAHWRDIALSLASALYHERKRAGAHIKWDRARYMELIEAVKPRLKSNPQLSIGEACKNIAGSEDSPKYFQTSKHALMKALQRAKSLGIVLELEKRSRDQK